MTSPPEFLHHDPDEVAAHQRRLKQAADLLREMDGQPTGDGRVYSWDEDEQALRAVARDES